MYVVKEKLLKSSVNCRLLNLILLKQAYYLDLKRLKKIVIDAYIS